MNNNPFFLYLKERFGLSLPNNLEVYETENKVFIYTKELNYENVERVERRGLLAATKSKTYKPTTNFLQVFGELALKHVVFLSKEQSYAFAKGESLPIETEWRGYVVVLSEDSRALGCGLAKDGQLINQVAKSRRLRY